MERRVTGMLKIIKEGSVLALVDRPLAADKNFLNVSILVSLSLKFITVLYQIKSYKCALRFIRFD